MIKEKVDIRSPRPLTPRERLWLDNFKARETPGSLRLSDEYVNSLHKGDLVLEVGCASGRVAVFLAKKKGVFITGIDINPSEINYAKENSTDPNVSFEVMDGRQLEYQDNQFDSVVMVGVLGGVEKEVREELLAEAYRVLKPGGKVAIAEFAMNLGDPKRVEKYKEDEKTTGEWGGKVIKRGLQLLIIGKHFTEEELKEMFKNVGFSSINSKEDTIKTRGIGDGIEEERRQLTVWGVKPL